MEPRPRKDRGDEVRNLRTLCKIVTGRTSPTPITSINKTLREHSDEYLVKVSRGAKGTPSHLGYIILEVVGLKKGTVNPHTKRMGFPFTRRDFITSIVKMDEQAERDYGISVVKVTAQPSDGW